MGFGKKKMLAKVNKHLLVRSLIYLQETLKIYKKIGSSSKSKTRQVAQIKINTVDFTHVDETIFNIDSNIELDQYHLNDEPYENEIEDYIQIIKNNNNEDSLESLNYKLREASRIGDSELQKYYLQLIVNKNKNRM